MKSIRIIGIGNPLAGDDAVGIQVIRLLQASPLPQDVLVALEQVSTDLLDLMEDMTSVILIDAIQSGNLSGTIYCLNYHNDREHIFQLAQSSQTSSTHSFGLSQVLALGQTLGTLPPELILYGIELGHTVLGTNLSQPVAKAKEQVSQLITERIKQLTSIANFLKRS